MFTDKELQELYEGVDIDTLATKEPVRQLSDSSLEDGIKCVASHVSDQDILKGSINEVDVLVHSSQVSKLMTGNFGLSNTETELLEEYILREKGEFFSSTGKPLGLTDIMKENMKVLLEKRDNPQLGETAKSYIDEIFTSNWYGIPKDMYSKYTAHGNVNEPFSIDMLNRYLGTSFVKNEQSRTDLELLLTGTVDIDAKDEFNAVIDIKNPYDPHTFDRNRCLEITDRATGNKHLDNIQFEYYCQGQAYMELWDVENFYLFFTLNENYYMEKQNEYERFGFLDRVIVKHCKRDRTFIDKYRERLPAIKDAILDAKIKRMQSIIRTEKLISVFKN